MEQDIVDQSLPDSENPANTGKLSDDFILTSYAMNRTGSKNANPDYRERAFYIWYNNGRPGHKGLNKLLKNTFPDEDVPPEWTLREWVTDFGVRSMELDMQVHEQVNAAVIAEKVEMMKRHAVIGLQMQEMALSYLEAHKNELSSSGAIRLLVEGIRIEQESRGIPEALKRLAKMSDDELLSEIKELMTSSSVTLEMIDAST